MTKRKNVVPGFPRSGRGGKIWDPRKRYISSRPTVHFDLGARAFVSLVVIVVLVGGLLFALSKLHL